MNIITNEAEQRPRAGWRLLLQLILFLLFIVAMRVANQALISQELKLYEYLAMGIAGLGSVWVAAIVIDRRPVTDFGIGWDSLWKKELALGIFFGTAAMAAIFFIQWSLGWLTITGYGWERTSSTPYAIWITTYLLSMGIVGFYEELIFRGYQVLNLSEGLRFLNQKPLHTCLYAVAFSSVAFAVMHAGNNNASWVSTFNIIMAGAVLAVPYIFTGRLALSVGLHFSWNFAQGGIFGFPVSGSPFRGSVIQVQNTGTDFITGGGFGPEAGLLGLVGLAIMLCLCLWYLNNKNMLNTPHAVFTTSKSNFHKRDEHSS